MSPNLIATAKILKYRIASLDKGHRNAYGCLSCSEIQLWKEKWARTAVQAIAALPVTVEETLEQCNEDVYSIIHALLKVLLTLPVSVAESFLCSHWKPG